MHYSQIANYINNGGFEDKYNCSWPNADYKAKYWRGLDSINGGFGLASICYSNVPYNGFGFQFPKEKTTYQLGSFFCQPPSCSPTLNRGFLRNRMKGTLIAGKVYCVKYYVCISDLSSYGISNFGAYFGANSSLDTITKGNIPITYLTPQVENLTTNIITDTLNWSMITGTFVANGTENNCVLGNFKSDAATTKTLINASSLPSIFTDVCIDNVSCIPIDLPAYAGPDVFGIPGNTVYLGRPQDVGIDEACLWYNLTNTTTPIANAAGITLTVAAITQTYLVKQDICGNIKYDTVVVYASAVSINNVTLSEAEAWFKVFPNPANEVLNVELKMINEELSIQNLLFIIYNSLGQVIKKEKLEFKNNTATITTKELPNGVYTLQIKTEYGTLNKKIVIER